MDGAGWHILLVEDDPDIRELLAIILNLAGYRVTAMPDAERAWMHLQKSDDIDLVLTDYHLPGMPGDALIRQLLARSEHVPAVLMSAHPDIGIVASACGADAVFCKVTSTIELLEIIEVVLRRQNVMS